MEKRTTHRLIGILVVIGLVVILLPLIFGGNNEALQTASVKAPPFKDQAQTPTPATVAAAEPQAGTQKPTVPADTVQNPATQLSDVEALNNLPPSTDQSPNTPAETDSTNQPFLQADNASMGNANPAMPAASPPPVQALPSSPTPDANATMPPSADVPPTMQNNSNPPVIASPPAGAAVPTPSPQADPNMMPPAQPTQPTDPNAMQPQSQATPTTPNATGGPINSLQNATALHQGMKKTAHAVSSSHPVRAHEQLVKFKQALWAVQMGSFKNKDNAKRLAHTLRVHGYQVFTRQVKSTLRVYVGPVIKQAKAETVADKIERDMNMHGIVITFHPLEL